MSQKKKRGKCLRDQILAMPDAPVGERSCDIPLSPEQQRAMEAWMRLRRRMHEEVAGWAKGYDPDAPDFWRRALEVLHATGLHPRDYNALSQKHEMAVLRATRDMKREQADQTSAAPKKERLSFDPATSTISLDGKTYRVDDPKAFLLYEVLAKNLPLPLTRKGLRKLNSTFRGDKTVPRLREKLPRALRQTIKSTTAGYRIELPPAKTGPRNDHN
jgi:hypothetical protein